MNRPTDPSSPAAPSVREIAALTARLREITARGREVAPAERAQFLADKDDLIARITAADTDTDRGQAAVDEAGSVDEVGAPDAVVHTFDLADAYTAAEIGAIAAAHARGDDAEVARVEAGRPSVVPDRAAAAAGEPVEIEMPEWMREQARATEAEIAAGTYEPGAPDDREQIAARLAELRAASTAGDTAGPDSFGRDDPTWWALTGLDEVALSHQEVAAELTARGFTAEQARAAVAEYLDGTSREIGISVHEWAMDSHDVEAIAHTHHPPVPVPEPRHPRAEHRPDRPIDVEGDRREQLVRWHTDDTTAGGPDRGADGDVIGSDRDDEPVIFEGRRW